MVLEIKNKIISLSILGLLSISCVAYGLETYHAEEHRGFAEEKDIKDKE